MRKQTDKKLISFSKLSLIDRFVKDEAEIENRSESAIIEAHLLESFLPKERNVRFWTEHYLYSESRYHPYLFLFLQKNFYLSLIYLTS